MSSDLGWIIFGMAVGVFGIGFCLFVFLWGLPRSFRQLRRDMRKAAEKKQAAQQFQPAAERMRGTEGDVTTWEFEKRREEITSRVKERLEMTVDCYVTVEHLVGWQRQMRKRKKFLHWRSLLSRLWWPATMLLLGLYGVLRGEWNWTLLTLIFGSGAFVLLYPLLTWWSTGAEVRSRARQQALIGIGPRRFLLTPVSVIEIDERITQELPWRNVQRIEREGDYTMFYLTPGWGWLFPKGSYASPEEYERFHDVAKECWSRARPAEEGPQPVLLPLDPTAMLPSVPSQDIRK
jgi:hypothetical protein